MNKEPCVSSDNLVLPSKYYSDWKEFYRRNEISLNKKKSFNRFNHIAGQTDIELNHFTLLNEGLDYFRKENNTTEIQQICSTISHEILHLVLFHEQGWDITVRLDCKFKDSDSLAEHLKEYGIW